jgi:hypothetical protein
LMILHDIWTELSAACATSQAKRTSWKMHSDVWNCHEWCYRFIAIWFFSVLGFIFDSVFGLFFNVKFAQKSDDFVRVFIFSLRLVVRCAVRFLALAMSLSLIWMQHLPDFSAATDYPRHSIHFLHAHWAFQSLPIISFESGAQSFARFTFISSTRWIYSFSYQLVYFWIEADVDLTSKLLPTDHFIPITFCISLWSF